MDVDSLEGQNSDGLEAVKKPHMPPSK